MNKLLSVLMVALLLAGCGKEEIELHTEYYENGQKRVEGNLKGGTPVDLWTNWHENGQKKTEGNHKDGKCHGLWTGWYENGQKQREETYKGGEEVEDQSSPRSIPPDNPLAPPSGSSKIP